MYYFFCNIHKFLNIDIILNNILRYRSIIMKQ